MTTKDFVSLPEAAATLGYRESGRRDSRLAGPKGNREVFLWLERS